MTPKVGKQNRPETVSRDRGRVLLITDEPDIPYQERLENAGFKIVGASAGASALVTFRRTRPHIVVADTESKGLSVPELGSMLSRTKDGVPLVLVGLEPATLELRAQAISGGAFDYFQLPVELDLLILRATQLVQIQQTMDRLREEADFDQLTGLANRRRFRVALTREVERWRRYGVPCALLLLDIDYMKAINDRYGHPFGDIVIRNIANTLSRVSRDNDTAARLGGEEFALLLAGIDARKASLAANRLHGILNEQSFEEVEHITVSIGLAACPDHANSERTLYAASDSALYVAKNNGRNQVAVAEPMQKNLPGV
ncbi:MAG TPA: diguanylate cyclase [Pyrinomonadaceae bacterium]|nr:diguanylate cyclase [Pyrinomonadaceae bacterium]